jgi:hypothetical protein
LRDGGEIPIYNTALIIEREEGHVNWEYISVAENVKVNVNEYQWMEVKY